jgi:hypothetical protein
MCLLHIAVNFLLWVKQLYLFHIAVNFLLWVKHVFIAHQLLLTKENLLQCAIQQFFYSQKEGQFISFLVQIGPHQHLIQNELVLAMIELKNCWVGIKKTIITHWLTQMLVKLNISQPVFPLSPLCCMLSREETNTNFIVFGLTRSVHEPTVYRTREIYMSFFLSEIKQF